MLKPGEELPAAREPVYPLSEGLTSRRLHQLAEQAIARAPELPEWIEPSVLQQRGWKPWRSALASAPRFMPIRPITPLARYSLTTKCSRTNSR